MIFSNRSRTPRIYSTGWSPTIRGPTHPAISGTTPFRCRPRKGDVNGRVFVFIPLEAEEQVGRFVFHCHILEHEDDGMMAAMEVVHEIPEKDEQTGGRGHVERQRLLDLADEVERVAALAVELVDKGQDRHVAQPADLEELAGLLSKPAWCRRRAQ